ncbi:2-C-methyl-D-erythritol 4-phosphate cytidylyltransferase [Thioalkalivibrio thiocyanodenitrificans]|uniref:2-C-methyl-D-erythritol 4-phosphate cytidylyltransferase n=1 Tax=Thioalkalivibrio thiocyanodenitrificans TaxID=243063 RepID=UPI000375D73D|nr:2-C-methyl-D-erythritol 4-phosphate cytidylyltransferase [Thioalkalivibrio thiocyanodenitrificans]
MTASPAFWAVIPAAGVGRRMGADRPKQYLELAGRTVLEHTLDVFIHHPRITGLAVAIGADDPFYETLRVRTDRPLLIVHGGEERCHSVLNALHALKGQAAADDWVLVHDAVRPCLGRDDLDRLLDRLADDLVGGLLATPVSDTLKRSDDGGRVTDTVDRSHLWRAFTPQMFRLGMLTKALESALSEGALVTDEASAMERAGHAPRLVEGSPANIKITSPADLALAEFFLGQR